MFQHDEQKVKDRINVLRRKTLHFGDKNCNYVYDRTDHKAQPWTSTMKSFRDKVNPYCSHPITMGGLNWFQSGEEQLNFHGDREDCVEPGSTIASISLLSNRIMIFRDRRTKQVITQILLERGSLLLMKHDTQVIIDHAILPDIHCKEPRASVIFRAIIPSKLETTTTEEKKTKGAWEEVKNLKAVVHDLQNKYDEALKLIGELKATIQELKMNLSPKEQLQPPKEKPQHQKEKKVWRKKSVGQGGDARNGSSEEIKTSEDKQNDLTNKKIVIKGLNDKTNVSIEFIQTFFAGTGLFETEEIEAVTKEERNGRKVVVVTMKQRIDVEKILNAKNKLKNAGKKFKYVYLQEDKPRKYTSKDNKQNQTYSSHNPKESRDENEGKEHGASDSQNPKAKINYNKRLIIRGLNNSAPKSCDFIQGFFAQTDLFDQETIEEVEEVISNGRRAVVITLTNEQDVENVLRKKSKLKKEGQKFRFVYISKDNPTHSINLRQQAVEENARREKGQTTYSKLTQRHHTSTPSVQEYQPQGYEPYQIPLQRRVEYSPPFQRNVDYSPALTQSYGDGSYRQGNFREYYGPPSMVYQGDIKPSQPLNGWHPLRQHM